MKIKLLTTIVIAFISFGCTKDPYEPCDVAPYVHVEKQILNHLNETIEKSDHIYDQYGIDYSDGFKAVKVEYVITGDVEDGDEPDSLTVSFTVTDSSNSKKTSLALFVRCHLSEHWYP